MRSLLRRAAPVALLLAAACGPRPQERMDVLGRVEHLETPAARGSTAPNLAVGPDGGVFLTWLEVRADSSRALRFATLEGEGWSQPRNIAVGTEWFLSGSDVPSLLVLPEGRMVAHYLQRAAAPAGGAAYGVRLVYTGDGGVTWSRPVVPHRDSVAAEHGFASLFPVPGDSAGVVWLDGRRAAPGQAGLHETMLRYTALAADAGLGPDVALDERVCDCCQTSVALAARGPVVAYRDRSADEVRDVYLARRVDGRWRSGRPVHVDGWKIDGCPVNGPAVDAQGDRVVVAWFTAARDTARVLAAFSSDGGETFGRAVRLDGGDPAGRVDVVLLDGGGALVSWVERTAADTTEVQARTISPEGTLGNPVLVAEPDVAANGLPRMVRSGRDVVFAWTKPGKHPRVQVARIQLGESQ